MKKGLQLSGKERRRIELKFECLRLSDEYARDYRLQQTHKRRCGSYSHKLDHHLCRKWFHFPLLRPKVSIYKYKRERDRNYSLWLEEALGGLIKSDMRCPQSLKVNSRSLRGYLSWKLKGYKIIISPKDGKYKRIPFPKGDKIYSLLNRKNITQELRRVEITLDLLGFTEREIQSQITKLLKELKPLAERFFVKKGMFSIRPSAIDAYLTTYRKIKKGKTPRQLAEEKYAEDLKNAKSNEEVNRLLNRIENQERTFWDHKRNAAALIEKGWWYRI